MTHLSDHLTQRRMEEGLTIRQVAKLVGYTNLSKGVRRIDTFEQTGHANPDLLAKLVKVLDVDQATVVRLSYADYCDWFATANKPVERYLMRRILHGGGVRMVPEHKQSVQAAEKYASDFARKCGTDVCLILSQRMRVWFDKDGSLKEVIEEVPGSE